jgi:hypothetical protein
MNTGLPAIDAQDPHVQHHRGAYALPLVAAVLADDPGPSRLRPGRSRVSALA